LNTGTSANRDLKRTIELNGPFLEVKSQYWIAVSGEDSDEELLPIEGNLGQIVNRCYEKCKSKQRNIAKAVLFNREDHVLYFDIKQRNGTKPFLMNMA